MGTKAQRFEQGVFSIAGARGVHELWQEIRFGEVSTFQKYMCMCETYVCINIDINISMAVSVYPTANSPYTHPSLFNPPKTNSWFPLLSFSISTNGNPILLVAQAKNLTVLLEIPSPSYPPHNLPALPVILLCDVSRIWPLSISSTAATQSEPWVPHPWTSGVASSLSPSPHKSQSDPLKTRHSCVHDHVSSAQNSNGFPSHSVKSKFRKRALKTHPQSFSALISFPSPLLTCLQPLWCPVNIPACFHFKAFALVALLLLPGLFFPRYLYNLFSHFIQIPVSLPPY